MKVLLYSGRTLVASARVQTGAKYKFRVGRGRYEVKVYPYPSKAVVVKAGSVVAANFPNICK